jgi:hypothetical protein
VRRRIGQNHHQVNWPDGVASGCAVSGCKTLIPSRRRGARLSFDVKALFVHRAVMSSTQYREVRELRAAREATAFVAMLQRAP